jgi:hypothetical protein
MIEDVVLGGLKKLMNKNQNTAANKNSEHRPATEKAVSVVVADVGGN